MTNLEISKALALAIGYMADHVWTTSERGVLVYRKELFSETKTKVGGLWQFGWRPFDYRDWAVAGPIAERYQCFPEFYNEGWYAWVGASKAVLADTPQKAIALAVIGAKK